MSALRRPWRRTKKRVPVLRLWHKVFIAALVFVMAAVSITAYALSVGNLRAGIKRETAAAAERHEYAVSAILSNASWERMMAGGIYLTPGACDDVVIRTVEAGIAGIPACVTRPTHVVAASPGEMPGLPDEELSAAVSGGTSGAEDNKIFSKVVRSGDGGYIITASALKIDGESYTLYTFHDTGTLYQSYRDQLDLAWILSVIISTAISLALLLSVWFMMRPIGYVNRSLKKISEGDYSFRLEPYGGAEIYELSENVNGMASSIEESMEALQSIADGRKQFIDNFAHEMKTPLTSIMGFADILRIKKDVGVTQRREFAGIIVEEAKRLRGLSGKLLELATADSVKFDPENIPAKELLSEVYASVLPIIARAKLRLVVDADECILVADKELIKSLLYNLIDNAVKASSQGGEIRAGIRLLPDGVMLYVSDDGMGMDRAHIRRITEPFYMVDKSRSRSHGGAGLGLALCDKIAKGHGGRLEIESEIRVGTTVRAVFGKSFLGEAGEVRK